MRKPDTGTGGGDPFEHEAERVASSVTLADARATPVSTGLAGLIQRMPELAHTAPQGTGSTGQALAEASSRGDPLPAHVRRDFEDRLGHDFGAVRIHVGGSAAQAAQALHAAAYTVGSDIVFGSGQYMPTSAVGQHLLAHELTHVIQQGHGAPLQVQRQDIGDLPDIPRPTGPATPAAPTGPPPTPVVPISEPPEPGCPTGPTDLGHLIPDPPCAEVGEFVDGLTVKFCRDSDVFLNRGDRQNVRDFAQIQASGTVFRVLAFASIDGPGTPDAARQYNLNLSCHRAKRVARELVNAGVQESRIGISGQGPTDRFDRGTSEAHRANNRVVVIGTEAPRVTGAPPLPAGASLRQIADTARQSIVGGNYFLGADAYIARWTCGQFRSLSDVVSRATIQVEGQDFPGGQLAATTDAATQITFHEGSAPVTGLNAVRLSHDIETTANPVACAENRIADLAFHHVVRPQIPAFSEQHAVALHLLHLGGFDPCTETLSPQLHADFDVPIPVDPQAGFAPPCAGALLPGAISPQRQAHPAANRPTFSVDRLEVAASAGALTFNPLGVGPNGLPFAEAVSPPGAISVDADVTATGDPAEIRKFDVGFVQTVITEDRFVTYVGGQRLRWKLPLPLRDGPPLGHPQSDPPWFQRNKHTIAQPGTFSLPQMRDSPGLGLFPTRFVDLSRTEFARERRSPFVQRPDFTPSTDVLNPARDGRRRLGLLTWVVARRNTPPAPVSTFSTEFLAGKQIVFSASADMVTRLQGGRPVDSAAGAFRVADADADAGDIGSMQFHGATAADFSPPGQLPLFNEFLVQEGAAARLQAPGGMDHLAYRQQLLRIAAGPRAARNLRSQLRVVIRIDLSTGRVQLDDLNLSRQTIVVTTSDGSAAPPDQLQGLARDIFPEVRRLVLGADAVISDTRTGMFGMPFILDPLP